MSLDFARQVCHLPIALCEEPFALLSFELGPRAVVECSARAQPAPNAAQIEL
ncbi:MAG TPA: hypothetical protein VK765_03660 [Solirubrobacteraceae bacterium]|nr:hypothetical protein [Solirubrobacteraceae bacterium]